MSLHFVESPCIVHNALCVIFMILVSYENVKKIVLGGCTITSKTKVNVFWNSPGPSGAALFDKISKMLILVFEANSALSWENETKIGKITHSVMHWEYFQHQNRFIVKVPSIVYSCLVQWFGTAGCHENICKGSMISFECKGSTTNLNTFTWNCSSFLSGKVHNALKMEKIVP